MQDSVSLCQEGATVGIMLPKESFFGHMKDEIDLTKCKNFDEVKIIIDDWINYYNTERYQWELAKLSPDEYYEYIVTGEYPLPIYSRRK